MRRTHISSGGVVYKLDSLSEPLVLVLYRRITDSWHLPKGTLKDGESLSEAAIREVKEETGADISISRYLGMLKSQFYQDNELVHKQTHYYLMSYHGGDLKTADGEHDLVIWKPISEAYQLLSTLPPESEFEASIITEGWNILRSDQ